MNTAGEKITEDLGYSTDHALRIGTMWSIVNPPGSANRAHVHPSCLLSGVRGDAPHGHWRTQAFVAALRQDALSAPCVFDGPISAQAFLA
ncbi:hypothetical protein DR046_03820 [Jannaschia formosa]|nr:hypothetical protein DR046_03820 [Jannaschia formosa]